MYPTVTVICPIYNNPEEVKKLIPALLNQDYNANKFNVMLVDNGSSKKNKIALKKLIKGSNKFTIVNEDKIIGSYAARNKGIINSNSSIFAFIDSDCIPNNDWISKGVSGLNKYNSDYAGGKIEHIYSSKKPNIFEKFSTYNKLNQEYYIKHLKFAATGNLFVYKKVIDNVGLFNHSLVSSGDFEFGQRVYKAGFAMVYLPDAIVLHPAHSTFFTNLAKSFRLAVGRKQLKAIAENKNIIITNREEKKLYKNLSIFEIFKILIIDLNTYLKIIISGIR